MIHHDVARALLALTAACLLLAGDARGEPEAVHARDVDAAVRQLDRRSDGRGAAARRGLGARRGWGLGLQAVAVHQLATDLDDGGRFHVDRLAVRARVSNSPRPGLPLTLALGYRFDGYQFRGDSAFAGAAWRVSDTLSIGPGFGLVGELEDDPSVFPVIVVDWSITPTLAFKTGGGLGATQGPGLFLEWTPSPCWQLSLGGRYDRNRFRLDDRGPAPGGIGQETSWAVLVAARYRLRENLDLSANAGTSLLGNLRLEDRDGDFLRSSDYDAAIFVGLGVDVRF